MKDSGNLIIIRHDNYDDSLYEPGFKEANLQAEKLDSVINNNQVIIISSNDQQIKLCASIISQLTGFQSIVYNMASAPSLGDILDIIDPKDHIETIILVANPPETMAILEYFSTADMNYSLGVPYASYLNIWNPPSGGMWKIDFDNNMMSLV